MEINGTARSTAQTVMESPPSAKRLWKPDLRDRWKRFQH